MHKVTETHILFSACSEPGQTRDNILFKKGEMIFLDVNAEKNCLNTPLDWKTQWVGKKFRK